MMHFREGKTLPPGHTLLWAGPPLSSGLWKIASRFQKEVRKMSVVEKWGRKQLMRWLSAGVTHPQNVLWIAVQGSLEHQNETHAFMKQICMEYPTGAMLNIGDLR